MRLEELTDASKAEPIDGEVVENETIEESYLKSIELIQDMADMMMTMREYMKKNSKTKLAKNLVLDSAVIITDAQLFIEQAYGT